MLIHELHNKKDSLIAIAHKYGATDLKIFGSVVRGEEKENSDVDFLVSLPRGYDMFKQRLPLAEELENIVGRKVDLIVRHEINKYLQNIILKEAKDL